MSESKHTPWLPEHATEPMQKAMQRAVLLRKSMNEVWRAALSELSEPAPDLAAEVERRRAEAASFHMDYRMKCDEETKRLAVEVEGLRATLDAERRKVEALRSASVGSRGWLVEWRYHGSVQWLYLWSAACGGFSFTADASEALRLARREDAEAVLEWARDTDSRRGLHSGTFLVTEHVWESAALASTEGGA